MQEQTEAVPEEQKGQLTRLWWRALAISLAAVAVFFALANITQGSGGVPLGYDTYYYLGWISQVIATGPIQFAASRHFVEFLYPIVASIPVYLGISANTVEILFPPILACLTIVALGYLGLMSKDIKLAALSVALASGWFALYRMGADFHANLLAFPIVLIASVFIFKVRNDRHFSWAALAFFLALVLVACATHVETTDFFIAVWAVCFVVLGGGAGRDAWRGSAVMVSAAIVVTLPFNWAYLAESVEGLGSQYCVYPPYWLQVFGPTIALSAIGFLVLATGALRVKIDGDFLRFLLSWSILALLIGSFGYLSSFPITVSDRALLLFPVPFVSAVGLLWLLMRIRSARALTPQLLIALALVITFITVPAVYSYTVPSHFRYFSEHGPSETTCNLNSTSIQSESVLASLLPFAGTSTFRLPGALAVMLGVRK